MSDNPFKVSGGKNPVTKELVAGARKTDYKIQSEADKEAALQEMREKSVREVLDKDRKILRDGFKHNLNGRKIPLSNAMRNIINARIKRAINILSMYEGREDKSGFSNDQFNEALTQHKGGKKAL